MKTDEQLKQMHDEAASELADVDATIARLLESREIARTVPGGTGDTNLKRLRDRRSVLKKRIADTTTSKP
jgi:hypothetical protein